MFQSFRYRSSINYPFLMNKLQLRLHHMLIRPRLGSRGESYFLEDAACPSYQRFRYCRACRSKISIMKEPENVEGRTGTPPASSMWRGVWMTNIGRKQVVFPYAPLTGDYVFGQDVLCPHLINLIRRKPLKAFKNETTISYTAPISHLRSPFHFINNPNPPPS